MQKYNYFLKYQPFYEKKFVFIIILLKINNAKNTVLQTHYVAKQHLYYRIIRKSTEKLRHIMEDVDDVVVGFEALDEAVDILLLLGREFAHRERDALEFE